MGLPPPTWVRFLGLGRMKAVQNDNLKPALHRMARVWQIASGYAVASEAYMIKSSASVGLASKGKQIAMQFRKALC